MLFPYCINLLDSCDTIFEKKVCNSNLSTPCHSKCCAHVFERLFLVPAISKAILFPPVTQRCAALFHCSSKAVMNSAQWYKPCGILITSEPHQAHPLTQIRAGE